MEMNLGAIAIVIVILFLLISTFAFFLIKRYTHKTDSSFFTTIVSSIAIVISLFCILLIPVDVYSVSSGLNEDGSHSNYDQVKSAQDAIEGLYYTFYAFLLLWAFIVLPFAYFFYEEEDERGVLSTRVFSALKYTVGFVLFFVVLIVCGIIIKRGSGDDNNGWEDKLKDDFNNVDAIFAFSLGCLGCIGLLAFVPYVSFGLARVPIGFMRSIKLTSSSDGARDEKKERLMMRPRTSGKDSSLSDSDLNMKLRRNEENLNYLESQYELSNKVWTKEDRKRLIELKQENRRLTQLKSQRENTGTARLNTARARSDRTPDDADDGPSSGNVCTRCWNALAPIRIMVGILLLCVSFLFIVSLFITVLDKFMHSACGPACGYSLNTPTFINPIDEMLKVLSKAFPVDAFVFGALVMYLFLCSINGLVEMGVRIFIWKLYSVKKRGTYPHALVMGCFWLMFVAIVINMEILTFSPQYASFGQQYYYASAIPPSNSTNITSSSSSSTGEHHLSSSSSSSSSSETHASFVLLSPPFRRLLQEADNSSSSSTASEVSSSSFYPEGSTGTANVTDDRMACTYQASVDIANAGGNQCLVSRVGQFLTLMALEFPFFSVIIFYLNIVFLIFFFVFLIAGLFLRKRSGDNYRNLNDDGDESD